MENVESVERLQKTLKKQEIPKKNNPHHNKKYPHFYYEVIRNENVDNVENYFPIKFSPILTTSPAPMVINKSPLIHFSNKKFSISSKVGK